MPSSWRTPLNAGFQSSHRPKPRDNRTHDRASTPTAGPHQAATAERTDPDQARASTRASSQSPSRVATATGSTFDMSPDSLASSVAASPRTRTICASRNRARSGARPATSSRSRSAASIIGWCIAWATREPGGRKLASIPSKRPASSGNARAWTSPSPTVRKSRRKRLSVRKSRRRQAERRNQATCGPATGVGAVMLIDPTVRVDVFHTPNGTAYADLTIDGHRETWPVRSARFRTWLRRQYYAATGMPRAQIP